MVVRGEDKSLVGGDLLGDFPRWGERANFQLGGGAAPPPSFPVGKPIYIYIYIYIVSAYVLIPVVFSVSQGTEKLNKLPQAHKKP